MIRIPLCPNCKHTDFRITWVKRYKKEKSTFSFRDYAREILRRESQKNTYEGTIVNGTVWTDWFSIYPTGTITINASNSSSSTAAKHIMLESLLRDFVQLVLECKNCGYTVTINIDEWGLANEL